VAILSIHPSRHPSSSSLDEEDDGTGGRRPLMHVKRIVSVRPSGDPFPAKQQSLPSQIVCP